MELARSIHHAAFALGLACVLPATAHAAVVYNQIIVQDALGTVLASVSATPAQIAADPGAVYYVSGIAIDQSEIGDFGVVVDSDGNSLEIFGIGNGGPDGYDLSFGGPGAAAGYFPQNAQDDTGAPIDLTVYLDPGLQVLGDTATFLAAAPSTAVPEPLTWAMMVIGFAAIGSGMRRKASFRKPAATAP